jgi:peptide/nickel transport system substrate-binding protein
LGLKLVETMTSNLLFIGTVKEQKPIYHATALKNFTDFRTASYAYYRTYPYRPSQWFLDE